MSKIMETLKSIVVHVARPSAKYPAGVSSDGYYKVVDGEVIMCKPDGAEVVVDGKKFRRRFGTASGELSEQQVAAALTKEIRSTIKKNWNDRPSGFNGPIRYERDGSIV
jgi:hypothetical protein